LSGQSSHDEGILRRVPNVPGSLQRTPNIGIFRATVKGNQPHAIRTLNLITVLEPIGSVRKRLSAIGANDFDPIGHKFPFSAPGRIQRLAIEKPATVLRSDRDVA
jgi:hypothetical protein